MSWSQHVDIWSCTYIWHSKWDSAVRTVKGWGGWSSQCDESAAVRKNCQTIPSDPGELEPSLLGICQSNQDRPMTSSDATSWTDRYLVAAQELQHHINVNVVESPNYKICFVQWKPWLQSRSAKVLCNIKINTINMFPITETGTEHVTRPYKVRNAQPE